MIRNSAKDVGQVRRGIDAAEFSRPDQAVNRSGALAAGIRSGEKEILSFMESFS